MSLSGKFSTQVSKVDWKNWDRQSIQMEAFFGFQYVVEIVKDDYDVPREDAIDAQRTTYKENKEKDYKILYHIHKGCDEINFDKIRNVKTSKQAYEILENCYTGGAVVKKVELQALRRQYEMLQMEDQENVSYYLNILLVITNAMRLNGEKPTNL